MWEITKDDIIKVLVYFYTWIHLFQLLADVYLIFIIIKQCFLSNG